MEGIAFQFKEFPMPPSDNNLIRSRRFGKKRHYRTEEYEAFLHQVRVWEIANRQALASVKEKLQPHLDVHFDLFFEYSKVYCKNGKTKKMDAGNRIKALADAVSKLIGVDDSEFFFISAKKIPSNRTFVNIHIQPHQIIEDEL